MPVEYLNRYFFMVIFTHVNAFNWAKAKVERNNWSIMFVLLCAGTLMLVGT